VIAKLGREGGMNPVAKCGLDAERVKRQEAEKHADAMELAKYVSVCQEKKRERRRERERRCYN
jgi:hypothetical protein